MSYDARPTADDPLTNLALGALGGAFGVGSAIWASAVAAAAATGHGAPRFSASAVLRLVGQPSDPTAAWGSPMPSAGLYWSISAGLFAAVGATVGLAVWWWLRNRRPSAQRPQRLPGTASSSDVRRAGGRRALMSRAATVRPSLTSARPSDVGYRLGHSRGGDVWATVEDSMLLVGPPRSGKGLHIVIPAILDAPGAVISTSTRPDNLAVTMAARMSRGPVAVFDPQHLAPGLSQGLRWSPVRGCEDPQTAMVRARGLAAGTGLAAGGVEAGDFWQGQTEAALRGLLHAAALSGRDAHAIYRWSLDPAAAREAVRVLSTDAAAADGWADALDAAATADPRTRDSIWLGVRQALGALADPRVMRAVTPRDGECFKPGEFITDRGTLFLLGTAAGAGAAASLVAAFIEDLVETARRAAAVSAGARLDPPLLLALDEIGNLAPLPSLPILMSEGGGSGITTLAVLQSLSQARARWGEQHAGTIWDAAIVKIVLGGGSNARDLADLAALIGERDDRTDSVSRDRLGGRSVSTSLRRVPIMDTSRLRTLPFGTAVLLLRTAPPIVLDLQPWPDRPDGRDLQVQREQVENQLRSAAADLAEPAV